MASTATPTVGVVNAPAVAQALREIGFRVVSADTFRDAATLISTELGALPPDQRYPVVVAESDAAGVGPWVTSIAGKTASVVLLGTRPDLSIQTTGAHRLALPATVNDVLPLVGYQPTLNVAGDLIIEAATPAPLPTQAPAPQPALVPLPATTPPPAAQPVEDSEPFYPPSSIARDPEAEHTPAVPVPAPQTPSGMPEGLFDEPVVAPAPPQPVPVIGARPTPAPQQALATPVPAPAPAPEPAPTPAPQQVQAPVPVQYAEPQAAPQPVQYAEPQAAPQPVQYVPQPQPAQYAPAPAPTPAPAPAHIPATAPYQPAPTPFEEVIRVAPPAVADHQDDDSDDLFEQRALRHAAPPTERTTVHRGPRCEVIIFGGGKGGIGKSTQALLAADRAAKAGMRVTLIDANRGQADIRTVLRLSKAPLPTIYDAVTSGNPGDAVLLPDRYNPYRPKALQPLDFAIVQGPQPAQASPTVVTAETYGQVLDYAREHSDLVIVDTQIAEAHHSDLFDRLIIPSLISGAWWVAIVNESRAGADNLLERLQEFQARGVSNARTLVLASMYEDFDEATRTSIERKYGRYGSFIGSAGIDRAVRDQMNLGNLLSDSPAVAPATNAILHRVTGNSAFAPEDPANTKRGWFGRRKRG